MMDDIFEKLQRSQDGIKLSDDEKERLISACRTEPAKQKRSARKRVIALSAAAAAIAITALFAVPNMLLAGSKGSDSASQEKGDFFYASEESFDGYVGSNNQEQAADAATDILHQSYRAIYYLIPQQFIDLADEDEYERWCGSQNTYDGMAIVGFVRHFGISKEEFDKANGLYAASLAEEYGVSPLLMPDDYPEQEDYEVFNSDIIYSGDDKKINAYYREKEYPYQSEAEFAASGKGSDAVEFQTE